MFEPSRNLMSFHIAGFQYWDGALVLDQLKPGQQLELVPEFENPHDPEAVTIYFQGVKLGFVPAEMNGTISPLLYFGHGDALECRVQQVAPDRSPWHQVRVGVYVTDARGQL